MIIKKVNESPTIENEVLFDIFTPDSDGCFLSDPYKVDNIFIYYVQRDFNQGNIGTITEVVTDQDLLDELANAKAEACSNPSEENLNALSNIQNEINLTSKTNEFFFKEAKVVASFGTDDNPAWLSIADDVDNLLTHVTEDEDGNTTYGHFQLSWKPLGMREGDYFICYKWTPQIAGDSITHRERFNLLGSTQSTTSIPTHFTNPKKYETLQERYLPEMFKSIISSRDLTPEVLQEFNKSIAKGFTFLEDQANQMADLLDSNSTHESFLQLLGNMFGLKLRSDDPTLWRRQIKRSVPLFKKKGTLGGLTEALSQAGIRLIQFTKLWQVISEYTYQEAFEVQEDGETEFTLSKVALPLDVDNFEIYYRASGSDDWIAETDNYGSISTVDNVSTLTWNGGTISGLALNSGDWIRVVYKIKSIPGSPEQTLEDYLRTLPLADQRDERTSQYPLKNWNVRVIEEDDALIDSLIPTKHPFSDWLVYGKVRTEFPYSENVYNMEEYNGSKRDSLSPCDIDKDFIDPCSGGLSSKFNITLEIDNISDDRISEATDIVKEFTPFHAILHSVNLIGNHSEFVQPPEETITALINFYGHEYTIVDPPQMIFNRSMDETSQFQRGIDGLNRYESLANFETVATNVSATGSNNDIVLFSPNEEITRIDFDSSLNLLEVLSPSANSGSYTLDSSNFGKHYAKISSGTVTEPVNETAFTFRISNEIISKSSVSIDKDNYVTIKDDVVNFGNITVITEKETDGSSCHKITIGVNTYNIYDILPDGSFVLNDSSTLPTSNSNGVSYTIKNSSNVTIAVGTNGSIKVSKRGLVDISGGNLLVRGISVSAASINDIRNVISIGNYALYNGTQYVISGFKAGETKKFYISEYNSGNVSGVALKIYDRVHSNLIGYFKYGGLTLTTATNYESSLEIMNGSNPPSEDNVLDTNKFKESFLIVVSNAPMTSPTFGPDYYAISGIDGNSITLSGPMHNWKTSGTNVVIDILQFTKTPYRNIPERISPPMKGYTFDFIDRRGNEVIEIDSGNGFTALSASMTAQALNSTNNNAVIDPVAQIEKINFSIKWKEEGV